MKSELTKEQTKDMLGEAEEAYPGSDFVSSVSEWFDKNSYITDKQEDALARIIERGNDMRNGLWVS